VDTGELLCVTAERIITGYMLSIHNQVMSDTRLYHCCTAYLMITGMSQKCVYVPRVQETPSLHNICQFLLNTAQAGVS